MQNEFYDILEHPELFNECISIYEDSFPAWEREDVQNIYKNIQNSSYKMCALLKKHEVIGFYILDINPTLGYTLFSFLAIKESKRGGGLGSQLCLHAMQDFKKNIQVQWLLIEAQERQAQLYKRLGFSKINVEYRVPSFNSDASIPMQLMQLNSSQKIDKVSLNKIIKDIFIRGYALEENDVRISEQLLRINNME